MSDYARVLSNEESLDVMSTQALGRLVVRRQNDMDLFPVNFKVKDGKIYFRTAEGTKLFSLVVNADVLFEVDEVNQDEQTAWSVIVKGNARRIEDDNEMHQLEEIGLEPWLPTLKYNFVEITPVEISGRRFKFGAEPERY